MMTETRGTYQVSDWIPVCEPHLGGNEAAYVADALARNELAVGEYIPRFEAAVAGYVGVGHAVAVSSGTAALHLALLAAGVGPGDEVIVPALTFVATANAVRYCGAEPVVVDVEPDYWVMDDSCISAVVTPRTKAILPVHLLGHPVDLGPLITAAWACGKLPIVEDAAEALGARADGWDAGGSGDFGCLSFNGNKLITTGGGGMVLTNNASFAATVRHLAGQARSDPVEFLHDRVGYNYRMSNLAAALGCAQMEQIDAFLAAKRRIAETYSRELAGVPGLTLPKEAPWARSSWWLFTIRVDQAEYGMDSRALICALAEQKITSRPLFAPLHLQPAYRGMEHLRSQHLRSQRRPCPVAERVWQQALSLPSSVGLTESQQARVIEAIRKLGRG